MHDDNRRFGHTIFCDDVRQEQNGKLILIGVYTGQMIVTAFPHIQTLSLVSSLHVDDNDPISTLTFRLFRDREQLFEANVDVKSIQVLQERSRTSADDISALRNDLERIPEGETLKSISVFATVASFRNLNFERPCILRARFETERGLVRAGSLEVVKAVAETQDEQIGGKT